MTMALSETPIREALVTADSPWQEVNCHGELDSTNAASMADPRPWRVVTCRHQRSGRGRHARPWASPPESSVAVSLTVPMPPDPARWGWFPLVTGLAVVDALGMVTGAPERFALKWPNDVLAREAGTSDRAAARASDAWGKICGILCEVAPSAAGPLVVAGIGVNVAMTRADLPVPTATALTLAGFPRPGGGDVVVAIARAFTGWHHRWYDGSVADLRAAYRSRCDTLGREIDLHLPDGSILRGDAVDIADGGELVLQYRPEEHREPVRRAFGAGDVIHVRRADPGVGGTGGRSDRTGAPHRTDRSGMIGP